MSNYRFFNCSKHMDNYIVSLENKVVGFTKRWGENGDIIYFVVKVNGVSVTGARGVLDEETDFKPWEDSEKYVQSYKVKNIEYCTPFELTEIKDYCDRPWNIYLQSPKPIKELRAINKLEELFKENKIDYLFKFDEINEIESTNKGKYNNVENEENEDNSTTSIEEKLDIMGTFRAVSFKNETDPIMGLEALVTENFYSLFPHFNKEKTILISENRLFLTKGLKDATNKNVNGIKGIPDALLISYDKDSTEAPIKINLIEYECFGEMRYKSNQKYDYLNNHIIPQLIRFASTFSIVTDYKIRERTIKEWVNKIMDYIDKDESLTKKIYMWMKEIDPNIKERQIDRSLEKGLNNAFESNIRIILIIDELTFEQKDTIKNVINSFKLNNSTIKSKDNSIEFSSYIVRLEERIGIYNNGARFALSFQE